MGGLKGLRHRATVVCGEREFISRLGRRVTTYQDPGVGWRSGLAEVSDQCRLDLGNMRMFIELILKCRIELLNISNR